ncbi:MAG TPA: ABC transporter permease, partial [Terrimicrobiaceae bacterium]
MRAPAAAAPTRTELVFKRRPSIGAWLVIAPVLLWLIVFVIVPTLVLVVLSFSEQKGLGTISFTFTGENYARAFDWIWLKVLLISVGYALLTTAICAIIGYPAAYFIGRSPEGMRNILLTLVMIPFWTSFLIRSYAWITILSKEGLLNASLVSAKIIPEPIGILYTPFACVLGLVYNYLPFMILPIYTSVERLDT